MAFVVPMRLGGLSARLFDLDRARPPSPESIDLLDAEGEPIHAPGVSFGVDDGDPRRPARLEAGPSESFRRE